MQINLHKSPNQLNRIQSRGERFSIFNEKYKTIESK
jgi:hypothetical protein